MDSVYFWKPSYLCIVVWKEELNKERRFSNQDDSNDEKKNDKDSIKSAMFPQNDVRENHDENWRTKNDCGRVANRKSSKSDKNASHGKASDQS